MSKMNRIKEMYQTPPQQSQPQPSKSESEQLIEVMAPLAQAMSEITQSTTKQLMELDSNLIRTRQQLTLQQAMNNETRELIAQIQTHGQNQTNRLLVSAVMASVVASSLFCLFWLLLTKPEPQRPQPSPEQIATQILQQLRPKPTQRR